MMNTLCPADAPHLVTWCLLETRQPANWLLSTWAVKAALGLLCAEGKHQDCNTGIIAMLSSEALSPLARCLQLHLC